MLTCIPLANGDQLQAAVGNVFDRVLQNSVTVVSLPHPPVYLASQADVLTGRYSLAVYGYVRVSTERQADDGESLGAQQRVIEGYAMMNGITLDKIFVERGVSGSKPLGERPEGTRLTVSVRTLT
jgi:Resolvase, N terminal domain